MSRIEYIHVFEYEDGNRLISPGKGSPSGTHVSVPTPDNDREEFDRREWERVDYWPLPEPMPKSEFKDWWNDHKDDDIEPIPAVIEAVRGGEDGA